MNDDLRYEKSITQAPVWVMKKESNSVSGGCFFHWHEDIEIYVVISGAVDLMCNGECLHISENHIGIVNWCEPHKSIGFLDNTLHYVIKIDTRNSVFSYIDLLKYKFPSVMELSGFLKDHFQNIIKSKDNQYAMIGEAYIVFSELIKFATLSDENRNQSLIYTKDILDYIHNNISQEIKLSQIADELNISTSHMCRIFKKHTGKTIIEYSNNMKFNLAIDYLKKGYSVSETCGRIGFADYNYFSRMFKKTMGISPSQYKVKLV